MPTPIATNVAGIHPYFLGTDTPIGVDATGTKWGVTFQGRNAILNATFESGVSVQFKIPTDQAGGKKSGDVASFTIPNFGNAQWTTYTEHIKFEVRFPTPPKVTSVSVNIARQNADLVSDGNGGIDVLSGGVKVGALPRPFIDYTPDGATDTARVWLDWVVADPTMTLTMPSLTATEWATAVLDPTVITTSTASTATAYSNQRKLDRTQNGVLWAMYWDGTSNTSSSMHFRYSTDEGATWNDGGGFGFSGTGTTYTPNGSLFIDLDDYAHVVYKDLNDGYIYYRRGTPNAGRTSYTWSSATAVWQNTLTDYPDVVAHREGTGWVAHVLTSYIGNSVSGGPRHFTAQITSAGAVTVTGPTQVNDGQYNNTVHKYPSIDFNHTGDGKTVAGGTPHLYAAWSAGTTGAGEGIRFKKATYSGGTWTWGAEREIDSTQYVVNANYWLTCMFDGTRAVLCGQFWDGAGSALAAYDRDAADSTTTTHALADNQAGTDTLVFGSAAYDSSGNLYLFGRPSSGTLTFGYRKWTRATQSLSSLGVIDSTNVGNAIYASAKRGHSNGKIEYVYTDGTASPYSVTYGSISLGTTASLPTATETDAALTLGHKKRKALPVATTTDAGLLLGRRKTRALACATETDLAVVFSTGIRAAIAAALETEMAMPLGVRLSGLLRTFSPPVTSEPMPTRVKPFAFFVQPVSFAVVMRNGHFQSVRTPSQDETAALTEGRTWFTGGRTYSVDKDTQALLEADGYTVDVAPVR